MLERSTSLSGTFLQALLTSLLPGTSLAVNHALQMVHTRLTKIVSMLAIILLTFAFTLAFDFGQHEQLMMNILKIILLLSSVQHILQVLHQRLHGPCALPSQNMLLLLLLLSDLFFSPYVNLAVKC